eukprot:7123057-Ditylum_brightwellii.AAC.1
MASPNDGYTPVSSKNNALNITSASKPLTELTQVPTSTKNKSKFKTMMTQMMEYMETPFNIFQDK